MIKPKERERKMKNINSGLDVLADLLIFGGEVNSGRPEKGMVYIIKSKLLTASRAMGRTASGCAVMGYLKFWFFCVMKRYGIHDLVVEELNENLDPKFSEHEFKLSRMDSTFKKMDDNFMVVSFGNFQRELISGLKQPSFFFTENDIELMGELPLPVLCGLVLKTRLYALNDRKIPSILRIFLREEIMKVKLKRRVRTFFSAEENKGESLGIVVSDSLINPCDFDRRDDPFVQNIYPKDFKEVRGCFRSIQ